VGGFIEEWWSTRGDQLISAKDLLPLAIRHDVFHGDLNANEQGQAKSLGRALGQRRDQFFGQYQPRQGAGRDSRSWRLRRQLPVTLPDMSDIRPVGSNAGVVET
jgi:hypothetical protein